MKTKYKYRKDLTDIQIKQLFSLALSFAQQFLDDTEEDHPDVKEYLNYIQLHNNTKTMDESIKQVNNVYYALTDITEGEDITANPLLLSVSATLYIYESGYFKGSTAMKVLRLTNHIYNKLEALVGQEQSFKDTNKLMSKLHIKYTKDK